MDQLQLLKKVTEKLNLGHVMLAPAVFTARMCYQVPFLISSVSNNLSNMGANIGNVSAVSLRTDGGKCAPCDVPFNENTWDRYQFVSLFFTREHMESYVMNPTKDGPGENFLSNLNHWNAEHFNSRSSMRHLVVDESHPAYKDGKLECVASIVRWITSHDTFHFMGTHDHLSVYIPNHNVLLQYVDHYCSDGKALFGIFCVATNEHLRHPPIPKYQYIPLLTDAITTEAMIRTGINVWKRPSQITKYNLNNMVGSRNCLLKAETYEWSRWGNYAESILRIFERLEGVRSDLGIVVHGNVAAPAIVQPVPPHLNICLTAGIDTDCTFGNNRIGCILVQVVRPDPTKSREERLECLMEQFKTQCTENFTDAVSSYDAMRGFDTGMIRKYFSSNVFDIMFTSFRFNADVSCILEGSGGGFCGPVKYPYMYINSFTTTDRAFISYTTNWW
jgi:hypothetical protein